MKLFVVAISVENEYAGRVLDVSWVLAKDLGAAEKQVQAHCRRTFRNSKEFGAWSDLEVSVEEVPSALQDQRDRAHAINIVIGPAAGVLETQK